MTRGAGATARLFLAVDPPEEVCRELAGWARAVASELPSTGGGPPAPARGRGRGRPGAGAAPRAELRALPAEGLHITLCFLGSRPVGEIEELAAVPDACPGYVRELSVGAPLWLPPRRPRALAVEIHDGEGELERLQHDLTALVRRVVDWEPQRRRFRAH